MSHTAEASVVNDCSPTNTEPSVIVLAKRVFRDWEHLRVYYVLILGGFAMLLAIPGAIHNGSYLLTLRGIVDIAEVGIVANICYFTGPISETYVRWLGYEQKWVRWFLFVGGTLLSVVQVLFTLGSVVASAAASIPN